MACRAARLRGAILLLLAAAHPEPLPALALRHWLAQHGFRVRASELVRALAWLRRRAYADFRIVQAPDYPALPPLLAVHILPAGTKLIRAKATDPGVDLG